MQRQNPKISTLSEEKLKSAAWDFLYLLDRGYPRAASLQLVGNRYNLVGLHRDLLHRGVFALKEAEQRRNRLVGPEQLVEPGEAKICQIPANCQAGGFDLGVDNKQQILILDTIRNVIRTFAKKR